MSDTGATLAPTTTRYVATRPMARRRPLGREYRDESGRLCSEAISSSGERPRIGYRLPVYTAAPSSGGREPARERTPVFGVPVAEPRRDHLPHGATRTSLVLLHP